MSPEQGLRVHAQHLRTLARCHVSDASLSESVRQRIHYQVVKAYQQAAVVLDDAATQIEDEAR